MFFRFSADRVTAPGRRSTARGARHRPKQVRTVSRFTGSCSLGLARVWTSLPPLFRAATAALLLIGSPSPALEPGIGAPRPTPPNAAPSKPSAPGPTAIAEPQAVAAALKQEAIKVAGQVAAAYPDDALSAALLGSAYYNTGRSAEATEHLLKCLALNPAQVDAYEILARVAYEKGDPEESARRCRQALKHAPPTSEILNRLGRSLLDLGQSAEAVAILEQATALPQSTAESHYLLGQAHLQSGNLAPAKTGFLNAIARVPGHTQAHFGLYTTCQRLGQPEEAARYREQFQRLEALDRQALNDRSAQEDTLTGLPLVRKTVARTVFGAAQIHRVHQQPDQAAALFLRAAELDADQPQYRSALEAHFVQTQALAEGVRTFEKLAAAQPDSPLNHLFLGRLHQRLQQTDAAERSFRSVQRLAPTWPEGYRAQAELFLRSGRHLDQAVVLARKAVELAPTAPHYHLLAAVLAEAGDQPGAVKAIQQAADLEPSQPKYREFLRKLQETPPP